MSKKNRSKAKSNSDQQQENLPEQSFGALQEMQGSINLKEIENFPEPYRGEVVRLLINTRKSSTPPPEELEQYEKIYPGAAKLIFDMMKERQDDHLKTSDHNREMHKINSGRDYNLVSRGQIWGGMIALSAFVSATFIGLYGGEYSHISGSVLAGGAVLGLVKVFLTSYKNS